MARNSPCTPELRRGRLRKANQFIDAASVIAEHTDADDIADAFVTMCVHAGIAAADVICCVRLGQHAQGEDHAEAVALLSKADSGSAKHLRVLLGMKTKAGYSHAGTTSANAKRAVRAAEALVEAARRVSAG
jgi:hypothetical protein